MIQEECCIDSEDSPDCVEFDRPKQIIHSPLYEESMFYSQTLLLRPLSTLTLTPSFSHLLDFTELKQLNLTQLNEVYLEVEVLIQEYSETLISELALRDELEYEKELKNSFIDLLVSVQNRRRQYHAERKRSSRNGNSPRSNNMAESKYLTTVIPYQKDSGPPNNQALQVLIKSKKIRNLRKE